MLGLIRLFVRHPTAGNLLMALMLLAGVVGLLRLNKQFFPDFGIDVIQVSVAWPGATALDVENTIIEAIEPEVRFLDAVDQVTSSAVEGAATVFIEFEPGADMQKALSEVESAVSRVTTLPEEAEEPSIRRFTRYETIARLVLSGPLPEAELQELAEDLRDELLDAGVDRVTFTGLRDEEIQITTRPDNLWRLDLTLDDIAETIRERSRDVPAGDLGGGYERQPRVVGEATDAEAVARLPLVVEATGARVNIGDIATVTDGFDPDQPTALRGGDPAIELHVQRAAAGDALAQAAIVDDYLAERRVTLPDSVTLGIYDRESVLIEDRINLLLLNGFTGLILVVGVLFLFLNSRVAFWVAAGIPIALMAMLGLLLLAGMTINMISMLAMILALGIVVDDAIVVGEHSATLRERGVEPLAAAEGGVLRMAAPVTSASLTTIASFLPIILIGGVIGQIVRDIPLVIIAVLLASLVECFLVLPTHMRHALAHEAKPARWRRAFNRNFDAFRDGAFLRTVALAMRWRYVTLSIAVAALVLIFGLVLGGRVPFVFFDGPPGDKVNVNVQMAPGTSKASTAETLTVIEDALAATVDELTDGRPENLVVLSVGVLGKSVGGQGTGASDNSGDNIGGLIVELVPGDEREVDNFALIRAWRERIPDLPGVESLSLRAPRGGPPGREVDIRLQDGTSTRALKQAALEAADILGRIPGVSQIEDDLPYGKEEVLIRLTPRGEALGFTTSGVGEQLRNALQGRVAKRFARGNEEVDIIVQLDPASRATLDLAQYPLKSPTDQEVRLGEVATLEEARGFSRILREDGRRRVSVTAELDEDVVQLDQVIEAMQADDALPALAERYGFTFAFKGKAEEQAETLADLKLGALIGLGLIYIILAWVFGSFTRPFAVMLVIPFGLIGAVIGHLLLGFSLTILSLIALLGLSGILVNDSIILVSTVDEKINKGVATIEAAILGARDRLRAVLLTSLTTVLGMLPLLFETSLQAQFLMPMVVTIAFGLMVTTFLVLFLVPALIGVQHDIARGVQRLGRQRGRAGADESGAADAPSAAE